MSKRSQINLPILLSTQQENKAAWFTPEVLRARVFMKELSTAQCASVLHTAVPKPGSAYYPSELNILPDEGSKGRWVHLVSLGLQVAQITWAANRQLPFYVRGLMRGAPISPSMLVRGWLFDLVGFEAISHHVL